MVLNLHCPNDVPILGRSRAIDLGVASPFADHKLSLWFADCIRVERQADSELQGVLSPFRCDENPAARPDATSHGQSRGTEQFVQQIRLNLNLGGLVSPAASCHRLSTHTRASSAGRRGRKRRGWVGREERERERTEQERRVSNRTESGEKLRGNHSDCECTLELTRWFSISIRAKLLFALLRDFEGALYYGYTTMRGCVDVFKVIANMLNTVRIKFSNLYS